MVSPLAGKRALITGASGALGKAIAHRMAAEGAAVAVHYNSNQAGADELVAVITADGGQAVAIGGDIATPDGGTVIVERAIAELGGIDILVNNAGITRDTLLMRMRDEQWDEVLTTNLRSAFVCSRRAVREMIRQREGRIINVSSVVGISGNPGQTNYAAAKAGLIGFTKALAKEVAGRGVTVNAIAPGFVISPMTNALPADLQQQILERIPLQRFAQPEEIAGAVVFLASADAAYITGQVLAIDGGLVMG